MKVFIQSLNNVPTDDWGFAAYLGFRQRQMDIIFYEDIMEVPNSRENIVVGCIEDTKKFWERLNISIPEPLNIPISLQPYCDRNVLYTSVGKVRNDIKYPFFIKPYNLKEFVPGVVKNDWEMNAFYNLPIDTPVMISEVVDFVSEYRTFVCDAQILGVKHYLGDHTVFPDGNIIKEMIATYTDAPSAYSLDVGVTKEGKTLLVECNDGWSLGNYGLDGIPYTKLLCKRWLEILKNSQK